MLVGKASVLNLPSLLHWAVRCQVRPGTVQEKISAVKRDPSDIASLPSRPMHYFLTFNTTHQG